MDDAQENIVPEGYSSLKVLFREYGMECSDEVCSILLEPIYKITRDILFEAKELMKYANRNEMTETEIEVATKRVLSNIEFNSQNTLDAIKESSESINIQSLPVLKSFTGVKFPHDRNNLTAPNFEVKPRSEIEAQGPGAIHQMPFSHQPSFITRNVSAVNYYVPK